jgi:hypothetical protein
MFKEDALIFFFFCPIFLHCVKQNIKTLDGSVPIWQEKILFGKKKHSKLKRNDVFCGSNGGWYLFCLGVNFITLFSIKILKRANNEQVR